MRICYIHNMRFPTERAHGAQVAFMCNALSKVGVEEVVLAYPRRYTKIKEDPFSYYGIEKNFLTKPVPTIDTQIFIHESMPAFLNMILSYFQHFTFSFSSLIFLRKEKIIYSRDEISSLLFSFTKKKNFLEIHDLPKRIKPFYRIIFRRMTGIVTISSQLKEELISEFDISPNKILVAHDAIDGKAFLRKFEKESAKARLGVDFSKFIIMYIGALEDWKGYKLLLKASKILKSDFEIVIIGKFSSSQQIYMKKYPRVKFMGFMPYRDLPKNQAAADLLVIPNSSKYEISRKYTSPLKLFAHLCSRRPLLVSDLPSLREVVSEREVFFFKPDNVRDFIRVVYEVRQNHSIVKAKTERAYEKAKEYTWEKRGKRIIEFIEEK